MKTRIFLAIAALIGIAAAVPAFADTSADRPSIQSETSTSTTMDDSSTSTTNTTTNDSSTSTTNTTTDDVSGNCDEPEHVKDPHCTDANDNTRSTDTTCLDNDHRRGRGGDNSSDDGYHDDDDHRRGRGSDDSYDDGYHDDDDHRRGGDSDDSYDDDDDDDDHRRARD